MDQPVGGEEQRGQRRAACQLMESVEVHRGRSLPSAKGDVERERHCNQARARTVLNSWNTACVGVFHRDVRPKTKQLKLRLICEESITYWSPARPLYWCAWPPARSWPNKTTKAGA